MRRRLLAAVPLVAALAGCARPMPPPVPIMPAALVPVTADRDRAHDFARVFCSTLPHLKDRNGRPWGDCATYLQFGAPAQAQPALATNLRLLLVGDFGGDCLLDVRAFSTAIAHLKEAHQITVQYESVPPFGPSSENGRLVAQHIDQGWAADASRRYVLIGYGKGAADLLEALRILDSPTTKVAALVTIAGVVGGVWLEDDVRSLFQASRPWVAPSCPANVQDGLFSLKRDIRQRSLRETPVPVPGYSLVAASDLAGTSEALQPSWKRLSRITAEQDGVMTAWEAVLPGARYLGLANADHWAIALPFETAPARLEAIDRNHFPRDALLEAIVRYVISDLAASEAGTR